MGLCKLNELLNIPHKTVIIVLYSLFTITSTVNLFYTFLLPAYFEDDHEYRRFPNGTEYRWTLAENCTNFDYLRNCSNATFLNTTHDFTTTECCWDYNKHFITALYIMMVMTVLNLLQSVMFIYYFHMFHSVILPIANNLVPLLYYAITLTMLHPQMTEDNLVVMVMGIAIFLCTIIVLREYRIIENLIRCPFKYKDYANLTDLKICNRCYD